MHVDANLEKQTSAELLSSLTLRSFEEVAIIGSTVGSCGEVQRKSVGGYCYVIAVSLQGVSWELQGIYSILVQPAVLSVVPV